MEHLKNRRVAYTFLPSFRNRKADKWLKSGGRESKNDQNQPCYSLQIRNEGIFCRSYRMRAFFIVHSSTWSRTSSKSTSAATSYVNVRLISDNYNSRPGKIVDVRHQILTDERELKRRRLRAVVGVDSGEPGKLQLDVV